MTDAKPLTTTTDSTTGPQRVSQNSFFFSRPSIDAGPIGRGQARLGIQIEYDQPVPMRDGTILHADVFRPAAGGQFPVILVRTPYDKLATPVRIGPYGLDPLALVRLGYVVAIQDVRGTFASEGIFRKYLAEVDDGADTVDWAAKQPWSSGAVGMVGASYLGHTQLHAAMRRPPGLKAIAPINTPAAHYEGAEYHGGAFQLGRTLFGSIGMAYAALQRARRLGEDVDADLAVIEDLVADPWQAFRRLPLTEIARSTPWLADYAGWLDHPDYGSYGLATSVAEHYDDIDVPGLHVGGWYDVHLKGTLDSYTGLRDRAASEHARSNQRLIITPCGHSAPTEQVGDLFFGPGLLTMDFQAAYLDFFDTFLKGQPPAEDQAPVRIFVMGINQWRDESGWPLARAVRRPLYLRAGGGLSFEPPHAEADEEPDTFVYDPADPVPTIGGNTLMPGLGYLMGPRDRRAIEQRPDVLVYTTDPLSEDLEVTGPLTARLYVATSARDTDFTVALVDVHPDGRAFGIAEGILRLRYRDGVDVQHLAEPDRVYPIDVDLIATSNVFRAGHRIRVEVSSSNFPRFDRNPNHGGVIAQATESDLVPATQRVFHDANRASHIVLPTVPA